MNPFKKSKDQPNTELEEKWQFVGFFQSFIIFFIIGMPLLFLGGAIPKVAELSTEWVIIMASMALWPLFCLFTLTYWLRLAHNFGLIMYRNYEKNEKKRLADKNSKVKK